MSTLHHEDMLLDIFEEVQENFPYLDEEKQIEIANNRFQDSYGKNDVSEFKEWIRRNPKCTCYGRRFPRVEHASTSFEGFMNDLYYQLFYNE